jgi:hypothetical protein
MHFLCVPSLPSSVVLTFRGIFANQMIEAIDFFIFNICIDIQIDLSLFGLGFRIEKCFVLVTAHFPV